jgi:hypothetical protein
MKHKWWRFKEIIGDRVVIGMGSFTLTQGWATFATLRLGFQICFKNHLESIHEQYASCHDLCSLSCDSLEVVKRDYNNCYW